MNFREFLIKLRNLLLLLFVLQGSLNKMSLTWREREHEEEDMIALHDPVMVNALRNCGLLKFFRISSMRAQITLLQYMLDAWDPINQVFQIRGKSIPLTIEDFYFLTGLSRRGAPISLSGSARGTDSMRDYVQQYCREGSQPSRDGKVVIREITDRSLRSILYTIGRMAGSAALHVANRSYVQHALECFQPKVFNWCDVVLVQMKSQLTKVKDGKLKNFGFGSILTAFALEKIPLMQPQYIILDLPSPTEPRMQRWVDHMSRHAGQPQITFTDAFFRWLERQEMVFSEYPYVGMDFRGDPDLVLPDGEQWGAIGKLFDHITVYCFYS